MEKMLGNKKYILIFILPALLLFLGFTLIPLVTSGIYSFFEYNGIGTKTFIGIKNYIQLFTEDRYFPLAVKNSLILVVASVFIQLPISLILALVLSRGVKGDGFFRTVYFIPSIFSCLVVGLIFSAVFQTRHGTINNILNLMGIANIQWLGQRGTAVFAICVAEVWRNVGYAIIITLAGLQSVSSDYLEAGKLDGASEWQLFRHITLPLIMPTVNVNILFSLIYGLKMFDLIYVMTGGGPGNATESFGTLMMNEMSAGRYAQSVAVNLVFTVLLVIVSVVYQKFSSRWETVL